MYDNPSELYDEYLEIYFNEYKALPNAKKGELSNRYDPINLFFTTYSCDELTHTATKSDLPTMSPLENDEEVKEGKGLKILATNKLLTKLPILLAQLKAENNSSKLKNEIMQILYHLDQSNIITKTVSNNLIKLL